jgi:hypothetical protein
LTATSNENCARFSRRPSRTDACARSVIVIRGRGRSRRPILRDRRVGPTPYCARARR